MPQDFSSFRSFYRSSSPAPLGVKAIKGGRKKKMKKKKKKDDKMAAKRRNRI
jgi:hypothetical protein